MKRLFRRVAFVVAVAAVFVVPAFASSPTPENPAGRSGDILGIVPAFDASHNAGGGGAGGNLAYHGGPVLHTNKTYAIYWQPAGYSVSSNYQSLINRFFTDVAADSGKTTNVYYSDTQYTDG
jgi:hypothetical protein